VGSLGQSIAGGRLMAIVAVLVQLTFQLAQTRRQSLHLLLQVRLTGVAHPQLLGLVRVVRQQLLDPSHQYVWPGLIGCQNFIA
jgi:hypothetical protein